MDSAPFDQDEAPLGDRSSYQVDRVLDEVAQRLNEARRLKPAPPLTLREEIRLDLREMFPDMDDPSLGGLLDDAIRSISWQVAAGRLAARSPGSLPPSDPSSDTGPVPRDGQIVAPGVDADPLTYLCKLNLRLWYDQRHHQALAPLLSEELTLLAEDLLEDHAIYAEIVAHPTSVSRGRWGCNLGEATLVSGTTDQAPCVKAICSAILEALTLPGLPWLTVKVMGKQWLEVQIEMRSMMPGYSSLWTTRDWRKIIQGLSERGVLFPGWPDFLDRLVEVWLDMGGNDYDNRGPLSDRLLKKVIKRLTQVLQDGQKPLVVYLTLPSKWEKRALADSHKGRLGKALRRQLHQYLAEKTSPSGKRVRLLVDPRLQGPVERALEDLFPYVSVTPR